MAEAARSTTGTPRLRRVLTLWDLIFYGIVLIQPIAPVRLFGVVQERSHGFIVDTILIAMFAMMVTAFSYGRMAAIYPSAGSAYTYVGRGNPKIKGLRISLPRHRGLWLATPGMGYDLYAGSCHPS